MSVAQVCALLDAVLQEKPGEHPYGTRESVWGSICQSINQQFPHLNLNKSRAQRVLATHSSNWRAGVRWSPSAARHEDVVQFCILMEQYVKYKDDKKRRSEEATVVAAAKRARTEAARSLLRANALEADSDGRAMTADVKYDPNDEVDFGAEAAAQAASAVPDAAVQEGPAQGTPSSSSSLAEVGHSGASRKRKRSQGSEVVDIIRADMQRAQERHKDMLCKMDKMADAVGDTRVNSLKSLIALKRELGEDVAEDVARLKALLTAQAGM